MCAGDRTGGAGFACGPPSPSSRLDEGIGEVLTPSSLSIHAQGVIAPASSFQASPRDRARLAGERLAGTFRGLLDESILPTNAYAMEPASSAEVRPLRKPKEGTGLREEGHS